MGTNTPHTCIPGLVWRKKARRFSQFELKVGELGFPIHFVCVSAALYHRGVRGRHFPLKGALSRYSVIFCAILLWGKIMAAVIFPSEARSTSVLPVDYRSVYIVLCSEIYATAPESLPSLERSSDQDNSRSIRGAPQACFGFHEFSPFFIGKLVFLFSLS